MDAPMLTAKGAIELADGRSLSYSAVGPGDGFPVLYQHGAIGSPLRRSPELERVMNGSRIRYLMVDRPGFAARPSSTFALSRKASMGWSLPSFS